MCITKKRIDAILDQRIAVGQAEETIAREKRQNDEGANRVRSAAVPMPQACRPDSITLVSVNGGDRITIQREEVEFIHAVAAVVSASKWRPE